MLLNILQNSQEKTCARTSFLIKLQADKTFFTEDLRPPVSARYMVELRKNDRFPANICLGKDMLKTSSA